MANTRRGDGRQEPKPGWEFVKRSPVGTRIYKRQDGRLTGLFDWRDAEWASKNTFNKTERLTS